ncbi:hypothetical protein BWI93_25930 [Siphonobacter sp. BAB-5385]|nr:hypothetical protein BWI93_25930 [Siphonobacter sp. BAB-5385]
MKTRLLAGTFLISQLLSCTPFREEERLLFTSFKIRNQSPNHITKVAIRMQDRVSNNLYFTHDSLLIGPILPYDSIQIQANLEHVPTDRDFELNIFAWKDEHQAPLKTGGTLMRRKSPINHIITIQKDTIVKTHLIK